MSTTIQVSNETKQVLNSLKTEKRKTYDQIIQALINKQELTPKSMFGKHPTMTWNKEKDRARFDDENH